MHNIALLLSLFHLDFGHFALIPREAIKKKLGFEFIAQPVRWDIIPTFFLTKVRIYVCRAILLLQIHIPAYFVTDHACHVF